MLDTISKSIKAANSTLLHQNLNSIPQSNHHKSNMSIDEYHKIKDKI